MKSIRINTNRPELKKQLDFLIKQEFKMLYSRYRYSPYYLIGWTLMVMLLTFLPNTEYLILLKGLSFFFTGLIWIGSVLFLLTLLVRKFRRTLWRNKAIKYYSNNDIEGTVTFDDRRVFFATNTYRTELNWEYYSSYAIDQDSIFIFREPDIYEAFCISRSETGADNFEMLKGILKDKLKLVS